MLDWNKSQWDAFGRHVLTSISSIVGTLAVAGIVTNANAAVYIGHATVIVTALIGLASLLGPIYAGFKAASSASPTNQAVQTVKALNEGIPLNGERAKLIEAVAEQPDIAKIVTVNKDLATSILSKKVTEK